MKKRMTARDLKDIYVRLASGERGIDIAKDTGWSDASISLRKTELDRLVKIVLDRRYTGIKKHFDQPKPSLLKRIFGL